MLGIRQKLSLGFGGLLAIIMAIGVQRDASCRDYDGTRYLRTSGWRGQEAAPRQCFNRHPGETGTPSQDFLVDLSKKYSDKPLLVAFTGDKRYMDEARETLEPLGGATLPEIEQPF